MNAGISGNSSADAIKRMERDVISQKPDAAVVCFGLNDVAGMSADEYASNMEYIFRVLREHGIQVIYMTPNMYNTYVHGDVLPNHADMAAVLAGIQNENRPDLYYAEAKKRAEKYGCAVADAYRVWKKLSEYGVDTTELLSNRLNHPTSSHAPAFCRFTVRRGCQTGGKMNIPSAEDFMFCEERALRQPFRLRRTYSQSPIKPGDTDRLYHVIFWPE